MSPLEREKWRDNPQASTTATVDTTEASQEKDVEHTETEEEMDFVQEIV